jgi:hypothetical protein
MQKESHSPENLNTVAGIKDNLIFEPTTIFLAKLKNVKTSRNKADKVSLFDFVEGFSSLAKAKKFQNYRVLPAGAEKDKIKQSDFNAYSISIDFDGQLTGVLTIDIDIKLNRGYTAGKIKALVVNDPYFMVIADSVTDGTFILVRYPIENDLKAVLLSIQDYLQLVYGLNLDVLPDKERLRIDTFDASPFINWGAEVYTKMLQSEEKPKELAACEIDPFALLSTDPATVFNNSGLAGLEIVNQIFENLDYTITEGKNPTIFDYQRAGGGLRSIVAFYNNDVVKFERHSTNTGLNKKHYNLYELYKELKGFDDYTAQKELFNLGFGEWHEPQIMKPNGKESYSKWLEYLESKNVRLNLLTGVIEIGNQPLNDTHLAQWLTEFSMFSGKNQSKEILLSCLDVIANGRQYHPFLEFVKVLEDLPATDFSQVHEIDNFIDCFTSSTPKELIKVYFIRWMLGLFDLHLLNRMTKNVIIFSGGQNAGKTSIAKNILHESLKQYGKVVEFNQNKMTDSKIALCSILVACFDEFEDVLTKSKSLSDFKNLTSSYDIYERRPYRRNHEQMFRSSIIMATTNEKNILTDSTGNTRFLTIDVQAFNLKKYFKIDLLKVWRFVYDLHLLGQTSVLTDGERSLQANENINFESEDFVVGLIESVFHKDENGFLTSTEILIELERQTKQPLSIKRVGQALRKMGIERVAKKVKQKVVRGYNLKFCFES